MSNLIKKSFLISMVVMISLWGVVGLVAVDAKANVAQAGDLIKTADSPSVYYLGADGYRYVFNHAREYFTWYQDFSNVVTIPNDEMYTYDFKSTIVIRPGTRLAQYINVQADGSWLMAENKIYAVGANGTLHHIDSAATAAALYGENWESMIVALPDYLAGYYTIGDQLTSASLYPTGTLVKTADSDQIYYVDGSTRRPVTSEGVTLNHFNNDFVVTVADLSAYTDGTSVTALEGDIANPVAGAGAAPIGTGLTVALAADSPDGLVAPILATNVTLLKVNLTASADGIVTVNSLTFKRRGPGDSNDFSYHYLYEGATRLTNGKTLNSTSHEVTFSNLNLQVAAGSTKTVSLTGDVNNSTYATSGGIHYFSLLTSESVGTTATVNGTFPVTGGTTSIASVATGYINVDRNGTLTNPTLGQVGAKVAQFKLTVSSAENMSLQRLSLYHSGTADNANLTNLKLYQGSTLLAETAGINGDSLAVFNLTEPYVINKSTNKILHITATVGGSARALDTIKFYLDNESDLYAVGSTYGYGACVDAGSTACASSATGTYDGNDSSCTTQATCSDSSYSIVQGGQVTVANNGPSVASQSKGQTNVPMLKFAITAGVPIEVKQWRMEINNANGDFAITNSDCTNDYFLNFRIEDDAGGEGTSAVNCSNLTAISGGGAYYQFTDSIDIPAGVTRNYTVYMDLSSSVTATVTVVTLGNSSDGNTFSATAIKNTSNNQYITDIVPSTQTNGTNQTIESAALTTALGNYRGEITVVKGSTDVKFVEYNLTSGKGSAITINSIKWAAYVDNDGSGATAVLDVDTIEAQDVVTYARMKVDGVQLGTDQSIDSDGWLEFTNLAWVIPADSTKTVSLYGDISSNAYFNSNADRVTFDILTTSASATYIDAVDGDGNSITAITAEKNGSNGGATSGSSTCDTGEGQIYVTVQNSGTLNAYEYSKPDDTLVIAGTAGVEVLKVRFHATRENLVVKKLRITDTTATTQHRALESVTISYKDSNGATQEKTENLFVTGTAGYAQFTDLGLFVGKEQDAVMTVKANYKAIGSGGGYGQTGDHVILQFNDGNTASTFEVQGADAGSNTEYYSTSNGGNISGNLSIIRKTLLTFAKAAVTNNLSNGSTEIYKFTVSAAEGANGGARTAVLKALKGYVTLNDVTEAGASLTVQDFTVYKNGRQLTGATDYTFFNGYGTATSTSACLADEASGTCVGTLTAGGDDGSNGTSSAQVVVLYFLTEQPVESASPVTYSIRATFSGAQSTANGVDSASFYLTPADTASTTYQYLETTSESYEKDKVVLADDSSGTTEAQANIIWSDYSGVSGNGAHSNTELTSTDWTNGYLLEADLGASDATSVAYPG